ncbi:MAG: TetR/AcrR family transcriptional regulator [Candidatus Abyssobacteria bacterium SURF_17]|uniref:TetR/AcrR family transcriptional regulator n=1 Tax=Candidatus Abyssobacteria bacterium SURF_17 TaxID=2093361 RepID=A0A419ET61_9BACT|nr:MAG: TetR/AcrR family transcriptional regulator [Candidatus Abyssubacteria bacterium SURF_17]
MSPRVTPENRIPDIVNAAIRVFRARGYRLTQMDEIAKEAGVSKATLYYYFKSKIHLFYYLLENGAPEDGAPMQPREDCSSIREADLLRLLQKRLKTISRLKSINTSLKDNSGMADIASELKHILNEIWELMEKNRIQIILLEKSAFEFPELAQVYDKYARRQLLGQLECYLDNRIKLGAIRPLESVSVVARMIIESIAWFGFKQSGDYMSPVRYSKSEALPELVAIFVNGLKKQ